MSNQDLILSQKIEDNQLLQSQLDLQVNKSSEKFDQKESQPDEVDKEQDLQEEKQQVDYCTLTDDELDSIINYEDSSQLEDYKKLDMIEFQSGDTEFEEQVGLSETEDEKNEEEEEQIEDQNQDLDNDGSICTSDSEIQIQQLFIDYPELDLENFLQQDNKEDKYIRLFWEFSVDLDSSTAICQAISQCKNLVAISLPIYILDQKVAYKIAKVLIRLNKLSELDFYTYEKELQIDDTLNKLFQQAQTFTKFCQKFIKLRLSFSFYCIPKFNMKSSSQLRILQTLNVLNIDIQEQRMDKNDSFALGKLLSKCANLQKVNLNLLDCQACEKRLGLGLEKCEQLTSLKLQIASFNTRIYQIDTLLYGKQFFNSLANCKNLKNLYLEFSDYQIDKRELIEGLQKLQQLTTFRMFFCERKMSKYLIKSLAKLKRLVCFNYEHEQEENDERFNDSQLFEYMKQGVSWIN
ncbi:hypothetical protein ABPG74_014292 [Tetrahymena malaccensis]